MLLLKNVLSVRGRFTQIPYYFTLDLFKLDDPVYEKDRIYDLLKNRNSEGGLNVSLTEINEMSRFDYEYFLYKLEEENSEEEEGVSDSSKINDNFKTDTI